MDALLRFGWNWLSGSRWKKMKILPQGQIMNTFQ